MKRILMTAAYVSLFVGLAAANPINGADGATVKTNDANRNSIIIKGTSSTMSVNAINPNDRSMQAHIAAAFKKANIMRVKAAVINGEVFLRGTATKKEEAKVMKIVNAANPNQVSNMISLIK